jgi:hypothetical protein
MGNLSVMSQDVIESNGSVTAGSHKDHYWVDLDLSVKWATRNMGAEDAYKVGSYYSRENGSDPAATIWGGNWRMPTIDEWVELVLNCDWKWIKSEEFTGALGTSKNNGEKIYLPVSGYKYKGKILEPEVGDYWSSSPGSHRPAERSEALVFFDMNTMTLVGPKKGEVYFDDTDMEKVYKLQIRPVLDK